MKITYDQHDVTAALRAHIAAQGISLEGKSVDIKFTMKKGNAGILADVSIEAAPQAPDLSEAVRPALSVVVSNSTPTAAPADQVNTTVAAQSAEVAASASTGTDDASAGAVKTTSLFN